MKVSLQTIRQYTPVDMSVNELISKINTQLGGVEETIDLSARYSAATIVRIVSCEKHPNADKLRICLIDDGRVNADVPRNENGLIQVVCGAPNAREDIYVVWLPPASVVPVTATDAEPFILGARELRGVVSQGMLASPKELGLGDSHEGILELDPSEWKPNDIAFHPGVNFGKAYGLDDTIIDIENKMFTHRPDLFGQIGIAREIAGIQQRAFKSPEWYTNESSFDQSNDLDLTVFNDAPEKVPRFMTVVMENVEVKPSPVWLQAALVAMGSKPINNVVDVTNYVMLLTAQPTHAYDYDKLRGHTLGTRFASEGESITLLNHKTYDLSNIDVVIVDGEGPVGLAGIMGGGDSEVSSSTTRIVLEVANFDMYTIRRSGMRHGLFTEASTRFTKGQSSAQNPYILSLLVQSIFDVAGGAVASKISDIGRATEKSNSISVSASFINERLGFSLTASKLESLLTNVEFDVSTDDEKLTVTPPFWRTDIELPEDIVEEVGRLYGYENLPRELPIRSIAAAKQNDSYIRKTAVRKILTGFGANEVLTYSFVHEKTLRAAGQDSKCAYKISNALSPDLQYYRLSLMPSLLDKVQSNLRAGYDSFGLYEIGKTHFKNEMDLNEPTVPNEDTHVAMVLAYNDKKRPNGAAYYAAKRYATMLLNHNEYDIVALSSFDSSHDEWGKQLIAAYQPERSAVIVKDNQIWGVIGEFTKHVRDSFKLSEYTAGFELHLDAIKTTEKNYVPLSKFPSVSQDISLVVSNDTSFQAVSDSVRNALKDTPDDMVATAVEKDIYHAEESNTKTVTFRITFTSYAQTLRDTLVTPYMQKVAKQAARDVQATTT